MDTDKKLGLKFCKILMFITIAFNIIVPFVVSVFWVMPIVIEKQRVEQEAEEARIYDSNLLAIEVTNKTNVDGGYIGGNYYNYACSFNIKVTNNSTKKIGYFHGTLTIKNADNQQLMAATVDSAKNLEPGASNTLDLKVYLPNTDASAELWDTDYEELNIYFCTDHILFENSKDKYYDNQDVLIKQALSSIYQFQLTSDESAYIINKYNGDATEITLPQLYKGLPVVEIGRYAFAYRRGLTSIIIPDSITNIGFYAFNGCTNLTSITIPNSVTDIDQCAFEDTGLTSITIPDSVTSIGDSAFSGCTSLASITVGSNNLFYTSRNHTGDEINGIIRISNQQLILGCKNTILPNSITSIGSSAFAGCTNLTSIAIPDSVTNIGWHAFSGCMSLTSIKIPASVTSLNNSFYNCPGLTSIIVDQNNSVYTSRNNAGDEINGIIFISNQQLVLGCKNTIIPNSVTSIGPAAFADCFCLTSITIPNSVTTIGDSAFYNCTNLTSITIPNSVTVIDDFAFYRCESLTSIIIPDGVISIGSSAFENCTGLTSITMPNSVTIIDDFAFRYCESLTSLTIPDSVTDIGLEAFNGCKSLTSLTIPDSVTDIGWYAFADCTSLTSITIPKSVTSIGLWAFDGCFKLTTIYCKAGSQPDNWDSGWKYGCDAQVVWGYKG